MLISRSFVVKTSKKSSSVSNKSTSIHITSFAWIYRGFQMTMMKIQVRILASG